MSDSPRRDPALGDLPLWGESDDAAHPEPGADSGDGEPGAESGDAAHPESRTRSGFTLIGKPQRKVDGLAKAAGKAAYTDDISLPGMLHGRILRSPHPHARIVSIDASRALALEGVHAVITGRDMPVRYGIIPWTPDEYPLCVERVRYIGGRGGGGGGGGRGHRDPGAAADTGRVRGAARVSGPGGRTRGGWKRGASLHPRAPQGGAERQRDQAGAAQLRRGGRAHGAGGGGGGGRVLLRGHHPHPHRAALRDRPLRRERTPDGLVGHPGAALPAPRAGLGSGARPGDHTRHPAARGWGVRRQVRALRPGVLRRPPVHGDGPAGQDPLHPRRGVLRPPRGAIPST